MGLTPCISDICILQEGAFLGIILPLSAWSQPAHGRASHEKVTGGNTCTCSHPGLQKKKALFALIQGSSCSCFDVEQFVHPDTEPALQQCVHGQRGGAHVCACVCKCTCVQCVERGMCTGNAMPRALSTQGIGYPRQWVPRALGTQGRGCPGLWVPRSGGARPCTGSSITAACVPAAPCQPRSPPSQQQMFGAARASTGPAFHAGKETPSSAKVRTKLPPR